MDQIRATLAELMGKYEQKEDLDSTKPFTDPDVCRQYLTGICPHDLFENTKFYMGECSRIHSEKLRERYQNERKNHFYGYELETLKIIQPMIDDCDKKIARGKARVEEDLVRRKTLDPMIIEEAKKIDSQIQSRMARADELGRNGEVEESFKIVEEVELLKRTKLEMLEKGGDASYQSRLKPCDVCGALLSATDSDRRLTEHYSGKIHVGFQKLRDMSKTLSAYIQENRHRLNGRGRNGSREYLSERRTSKSESKSSPRSRSDRSYREGSRSFTERSDRSYRHRGYADKSDRRERENYRKRSRSRSRSISRSRSRSRSSSRSRSRDRKHR